MAKYRKKPVVTEAIKYTDRGDTISFFSIPL